MCLILHRSTEPQIATKDITCYKMIRQFDNIQFASFFLIINGHAMNYIQQI